MQRLVDHTLAVTKESVKTLTYESLNNVVRLINGVSALLLTILPGKSSILEGIHGWELRPTFRGPRLPQWMENGVSSFNQLIHELSIGSDTSSSSVDYSSSSDEEYIDETICPPYPLSQSSRVSRARSLSRRNRHWMHWGSRASRTSESFQSSHVQARKRLRHSGITLSSMPLIEDVELLSENLSFLAMYKRKKSESTAAVAYNSIGGAAMDNIEDNLKFQNLEKYKDLHLATEITIEAVFEFFHKAAHCLLSPIGTLKKVVKWFSSDNSGHGDVPSVGSGVSVPVETLSENDPTPRERKTGFHSLNTDARTCQNVQSLGEDFLLVCYLFYGTQFSGKEILRTQYPYEALRVVTDDGYILLLERIPRRDSRKVVYLQHGVFDSSMGQVVSGNSITWRWSIFHMGIDKGAELVYAIKLDRLRMRSTISGALIVWVSNGVVGSPAFAAYDQGYDVFLGNFRGLVSREHVDKNISSRQYWKYSINEHGTRDIPAMIEKIHKTKVTELKNSQKAVEEENDNDQPYKLCAICHSLGGAAILMYILRRQLEEKSPRLSRLILLSPAGFHHDSNPVFTMMEYLFLLMSPLLAPFVPAFYIPTRFFRMLFNKLARDFHNLPAVGGLVQTLISYLVGGDSSNWVGGSAAANMEAYGSPRPLDLGKYYPLIDIPVDLVAGRKDKIIRPSMVRKHYKLMKDAGAEVSYNEFEYAHLDFTFSHHEELLAYVMSRLILVGAYMKQQPGQKSLKIRRKEGQASSNC
ncbi:hypothetical protein RND71_027655 [Anisodus tanguticus]|uniref:Partial AB-hydrolase lipase domain-containing protein n=1 Tax=Anisodus tanguticus TaxID=243964 RepID=A0AAE1RJM2_9SOLA|nr:hypothetical protein RND71_027655 [Anisodus tanguticus]